MLVKQRPVMRYHGGKWRLAAWIISHFPAHDVYIEPFSGAASVLMQKPCTGTEVLNDKHQRLISVFRVIRDPESAQRLVELLRFTPYSEAEYKACREVAEDPVEDARRMLVLAHQAHGSVGACGGKASGWRRGIRPYGPNTADEWSRIYDHISGWAERLRGVFIECSDYTKVIKRWDSPQALFYVDPPYLDTTRSNGLGSYGHEFTEEDHCLLAELLNTIQGHVVISGYPSELYDRVLFKDWRRYERNTIADRQQERTEVLWISPQTPEIQPG
ncbi:MAG TPA: DNA adenine methylase, partial [Chromatiaceae bacterium]|nr:DNA adenine methylase [Chromatiaceae bacterium]